jgi:hypothetical protein
MGRPSEGVFPSEVTLMVRSYLMARGALLLLVTWVAFGGNRISHLAPRDDRLSPSFTWGEVQPASGQAGLSGVYHRAAIVTEMSVAAGRFVTRAKHTYWCFFPGGRCYYSMPTEGLDNFNYDYVRGMNALWCCTYTLKGDDGMITWGTGGTTVGFRRNGRTLLIGRTSDAYEPLEPCDGLRLEGTFKREDWQDANSPKEGITLSREGTFVDEGFLAGAISSWWWADRGLVEATFAPGRGTYRLANNSLVLLYADGRRVRANFHLENRMAKENVAGFLISARRFVKVG